MKIGKGYVDIDAGGGVFRVKEGNPAYGTVYIEFVTKGKNGVDFCVPVADIESLTLSAGVTDDDSINVYVFGDVHSDECTDKVSISRQEIRELAEEMEEE